MATKRKTNVTPKIRAKARQVLEFAKEKVKQGADSIELRNALYDVDGKASVLFPTEAERTAYCKTAEYKQIVALITSLPTPPPKETIDLRPYANGDVRLRLRIPPPRPRSPKRRRKASV